MVYTEVLVRKISEVQLNRTHRTPNPTPLYLLTSPSLLYITFVAGSTYGNILLILLAYYGV